jgi:hypothetical protein
MKTTIYKEESGLLTFNKTATIATKEDYELSDRCVGSIFESLHPGEFIELAEGVFLLDEDLDLKEN